MKRILSRYHIELVRDSAHNYDCDSLKVKRPGDVVNVLRQTTRIDNEPQEVFYVLALDTQNRVIGLYEAFRGTVNASLVSPREVIQIALLHNANALAVAHNHPSGEPEPSLEDIRTTDNLNRACKLMDLQLLDHVILGDNGQYCSLREQGAIAN
jgi:DNA repair protein RadC